MHKIFFGLGSQYFATFSTSGKQGFSIERCLYPEIELNWIEFIDKQPMKAGQGLKKSLAMRRLTQKKNDAHTQK